MADRRGMHTLGLSSLRPDREYPLEGRGTDEKCLIHVKLTESSAKDIDNLIASNKVTLTTTIRASLVVFIITRKSSLIH